VKWLRVGLALLLLVVASQRIYRWPIPKAFELSVGAAEWGHWLALAALLLGLATPKQPGVRILCAAVVALGLAPCLGAWWADPEFSWKRLVTGWGGANPGAFREVTLPSGQGLDLYLPPQTDNERGLFPGVLVVHGGSWARGSRKDFAALNRYLSAQGYFVASLDYRLAPAHPYPAALEDLDQAFDYVIDHSQELHLDPNRLAWLGRSAGGHLALLEAYGRRPSRCVVAYYPPTDMLWSYQHPSNPQVLDSPAALRDFLGGPPSALYQEASPLHTVSAGAPPTLLLHGLSDDLVYAEQSRRLQRRLAELGTPCQTRLLPWAHHGCDVNLQGPSGQLCTLSLMRFFQRYL